jgi:type IV pilus assembly protein PilA
LLKRRFEADEAFTLIELLVVIIIIGILASIAVIGIAQTRATAYASQCTSNANQAVKALTEYEVATGTAMSGSNSSAIPISTATISTASIATGFITYTASATLGSGFAVGNTVTVSGNSTSAYNVSAATITAVPSTTTFRVATTNTGTFGTGSTTAVTAAIPGTYGAISWANMQSLWSGGNTYISSEISNFNTSSPTPLPYYLVARNIDGVYQVKGYKDSTALVDFPGCKVATSG